MKKLFFILLLMFMSASIFAEGEADDASNSSIETKNYFSLALAFYPPSQRGYDSEDFAPVNMEAVDAKDLNALYPATIDGEARTIGGGVGLELKGTFSHEIKIPFMQSDNPLMNGNNVLVKTKAEISPVSVNGILDLTLTPIAFLNFNAGTSVGTGWTVAGLIGLGENSYEDNENKSEPLSGAVIKSWASGTFQFDLGALMPGDWTHIAFVVNQKVEHKYYSGADNNTPWQYEVDGGENFNGFKWLQTYFVGYIMPVRPLNIDTIGFLTETDQRITKKNVSKMSDGGWGSDFMSINFGPLVNFKFTETSWFTVLVQFKTAPDFTDETTGNAHFMKRQVDTDSDTFLFFNRVAFAMGFEI